MYYPFHASLSSNHTTLFLVFVAFFIVWWKGNGVVVELWVGLFIGQAQITSSGLYVFIPISLTHNTPSPFISINNQQNTTHFFFNKDNWRVGSSLSAASCWRRERESKEDERRQTMRVVWWSGLLRGRGPAAITHKDGAINPTQQSNISFKQIWIPFIDLFGLISPVFADDGI